MMTAGAVAGTALRSATPADLAMLRTLLAQLGYAVDLAEAAQRFAAVTAHPDHAVLVADRGGTLVAFCHVYARPALDKPLEAVVQALVVDAAARGTGLGRFMMNAAAQWALARGFTSIALASAINRSDAHRFYGALGFRRTATSHLFRKSFG